MESITTDDFGHLYNSKLEAGIRAVVVLEELRPEAVDLAEMVLFDYVVVHTADLGGGRLPSTRNYQAVRANC